MRNRLFKGLVIASLTLLPIKANAGFGVKRAYEENCRRISSDVTACDDIIKNVTCYTTGSGMANVSHIACIKTK